MGFRNGVFVNRVGLSGGLALLWREDIDVTLQTFSRRHIDVVIEEKALNRRWRFTGFYGHPETSKRNLSWQLLKKLASYPLLPWVCMGDFNKILEFNEKEGGRFRPWNQIRDFRCVLEDCGLADLGYIGNKFTWVNHHEDNSWTRLRLDRGVATSTWKTIFSEAQIFHLETVASDHSLILLDWADTRMGSARPINYKHKKPFRFEQNWAKADECGRIIKQIWVGSKEMKKRN